ncbi:MAG: FtsH protease activity modulator HflK [Candidatus Competibacteraceae bacterium]|jgi:membrane protease subunit HflK|nr:FtsH protease activity modulator HflK [Candidatus Competibacteraceae bacterium]
MAWNEPGGNNRDPWSGDGRDKGPPDLDEIVRKLTDKFGGLFGSKKGGGGGGDNKQFGGPRSSSTGLWIVIAIVLFGWLLSGIYIIDQGKRGVVLRFGRYVDTTMPGPHWRLPYPFERHEIVDVEQLRAEEIGYRAGGRQTAAIRPVPKEALMLTQDENIVDIRISVQFQISDPRAYLFNVVDPLLTLRQVVESAIRETIGKSTMDFVLTEGRSNVVADVKVLSQKILDSYGTPEVPGVGLQITNVNLQDAQPPEEVQDAFADAIKAREDEQRQKNEAEAYANEIIPKARGQAARRLEESVAYREQVVAQAEGEASRFEQLLGQYLKAPDVTRERLYLETMEQILGSSSKVLVDVESGNNLFYLPLDKLLQGDKRSTDTYREPPSSDEQSRSPTTNEDNDSMRFRDTSRSREVR